MDSNTSVPLRVRKGSWTEEEDHLLRKCIQMHGEGKWHQIPLRAGLNRCRKSCRLRWLNYLRPNIKRGNFAMDEVDLIVRLHKLLGNRWSLIAGRLPGRTANDVKNYWNTHLRKKFLSPKEDEEDKTPANMKTNVIRPRRRSFSKNNLPWLGCKTTPIIDTHIQSSNQNLNAPPPSALQLPPAPTGGEEGEISWFNKIIDDLLEDPIMEAATSDSYVQGHSDWSDIFINNLDLWDLLGDGEEVI